jgi:hypothetical protein
MWLRIGVVTGVLILGATPADGQSTERDSLARQLAMTMNVVASVQKTIMYSGEAAGTIDPAIQRRLVEGIRNFAAKYFTPDVVLARVVPVYAKRFTATELRQLIEFVLSPGCAPYLSQESELRLVATRVWQTMRARPAVEPPSPVASVGEVTIANESLARELLAAVAAAQSHATRATPLSSDHPGEDQLNARSATVRERMRGSNYREAVDAALVREYAQRHSATELRELIDFFRSPLGVRFVVVRIEVDEAAGVLTSEILKQHNAEFSKIMSDALPKMPPP